MLVSPVRNGISSRNLIETKQVNQILEVFSAFPKKLKVIEGFMGFAEDTGTNLVEYIKEYQKGGG